MFKLLKYNTILYINITIKTETVKKFKYIKENSLCIFWIRRSNFVNLGTRQLANLADVHSI